jgi:phosphorylcholine metabolism protein LicD
MAVQSQIPSDSAAFFHRHQQSLNHNQISFGKSQQTANIIHAAALPEKKAQLERYYKKEIVKTGCLKKLSRLLKKEHTPHDPDILQIFQIDKGDILKGVHCPTCFFCL